MSVEEWVRKNTTPIAPPSDECWCLVANSMHHHAEHEGIVALFDTKELAEDYLAKSKMPERRLVNGMSHTFRPDSYLWNFNESSQDNYGSVGVKKMPNLVPPFVANGLGELPMNPAPPLGDYQTVDVSSRFDHHIGLTIADKYWR